MKLDRPLSGYLDCLRFVAAFAVLLGHMDQDGLYLSWMPLSGFSHESVIIFFVMSGFIISAGTATRHTERLDFFVARASRIYSVALPAILFSLFLSGIVATFDPLATKSLTNYAPFSWWSTLSSLLFLNKSWTNPAELSLNMPYWSLCYEVWYYVIFGLLFFIKSRSRWPLIAAVALFAGPAIMVLFPIWLMGAWLASSTSSISAPKNSVIAWSCFLGSIMVLIIIRVFEVDLEIRSILKEYNPWLWRLGNSQRIVTDYIIGAAITLNIWSFSGLNYNILEFFKKHINLFKQLAGFSFTLYLFHRPLTQLFGHYFPNTNKSIPISILWTAGLVFLCYLISFCTERQLPRWRSIISAAASFIFRIRGRLAR